MEEVDAISSTITVATTATGAERIYYTGSVRVTEAFAVLLSAKFVVRSAAAGETAGVTVQHGIDNVYFADLGSELALNETALEKDARIEGLAGGWMRLKIRYVTNVAATRRAAVFIKANPVLLSIRLPPPTSPMRVPSPLFSSLLLNGFRVGRPDGSAGA